MKLIKHTTRVGPTKMRELQAKRATSNLLPKENLLLVLGADHKHQVASEAMHLEHPQVGLHSKPRITLLMEEGQEEDRRQDQ
jgi:hypothetical protein